MTSLARTIRHAAWTGLPVFLNAAGGIYTLSLNYRVLGAYDYGLLLLIVSINGFLGILASSLSLTARTSGALIAGQDPDGRALRTLRGVQFLYVAFGVTLFALSLLAGVLGPAIFRVEPSSVGAFQVAVPLIGIASVFQFQAAVPSAILAAHDRFSTSGKVSLFSLVARILALTILVPRFGLIGNAAVLACGAVLEYVLLHRIARRVVPSLGFLGARPDRAEFRHIVSGATMMTIVNASAVILSTGGLLYVGGVLGPALVSDLKVGTTLPQNLVNLVFVGYGVIYPRFVRGRTTHSPRQLGLALRTGSFSSAALFALLAMASPSLISLITGSAPSPAVVVVSTMMCAGYALDAAIHGIVLQILARERQDVMAKVVPVEIAVFVASTVTFVHFFGVVGAAAATLLTLVIMDLVVLAFIMRGIWDQPEITMLLWRGSILPAFMGFGFGLVVSLPTFLMLRDQPVPYIAATGAIAALVAYPTYRLVVLRWFEDAQRA